jgi:hypothetical protein
VPSRNFRRPYQAGRPLSPFPGGVFLLKLRKKVMAKDKLQPPITLDGVIKLARVVVGVFPGWVDIHAVRHFVDSVFHFSEGESFYRCSIGHIVRNPARLGVVIVNFGVNIAPDSYVRPTHVNGWGMLLRSGASCKRQN